MQVRVNTLPTFISLSLQNTTFEVLILSLLFLCVSGFVIGHQAGSIPGQGKYLANVYFPPSAQAAKVQLHTQDGTEEVDPSRVLRGKPFVVKAQLPITHGCEYNTTSHTGATSHNPR